MRRIVIVSPVEPAPLSLRSALGTDLDLTIGFLSLAQAAVDPDTLMPQLVLLPRSQGGVSAYDMETVGGSAEVTVPGIGLTDANGYTLELYQRRTAVNPADPAVPVGLLAKGVLRLEGSAYMRMGPLSPITVPVVVGPPGPQGIPGTIGVDGAPGPVGPMGPVGPANVLTVGTVTTGAPGSPAQVTITGTAPDQTSNFGIPSGLTGATGSTGATGPTGATGANITLGTALPGSAIDGALFWNTTDNQLFVREAGAWVVVDAVWG
jgi:hypothetical protein